jgi:cell division protein FtsL
MFWTVYLVLAVALVLFLYFFARRVRLHSTADRLSLGDYVSIVATVLNVILLVVAVVSLHVAVDAYLDAKGSGKKQEERLDQQQRVLEGSRQALDAVVQGLSRQQNTLEKARDALDSSVRTAIAQQRLLGQSVANSEQQLHILKAQWERELEQPDIHAQLLYPQAPAVVLSNSSKVKPVRQGLYELIMFNIDRPRNADSFQIVETVATPIDFIPPEGSYLPTMLNLHLDPNEPLAKGNRLFGYLSISCADCATRRAYWILIKWGEAGWYREAKNDGYPFFKLKPNNIEVYVSDFLSRKDLLSIPLAPD